MKRELPSVAEVEASLGIKGRFQPYTKTRESGVEWLGRAPLHWQTRPLKYSMGFVNGAPFKPSEWTESGIPIIRIENLNGGEDFNCFEGSVERRYHVNRGDLLFAWSGNRGTSFGPFIWPREGLHYLNQHIFRLEGFTCDKAWLYWTLKGLTFYVEAEAHGIIGLVHITKGKLGTIAIPVIERTEQQAITAFLDRETAKIDALVEKKRRLIELLKEKRAALISHAVTKGLNPDVPMKDSGTHWAGRLPTHWKECSLKYLATVDTGGTPDRNRPEYWNGDIPWVKTGEVNYDRIKGTAEHITTDGLRNSAAKIADPGTMLMALYGEGVTRGRVAILGIRAAYNQACAGIKFRKRLMLSGYARFWFMSAYEHIRDNGNETTQMNLSCGAIRNFKLPVPPLKEQQRITEFLDGESEKFDGLVAKVEAAIDRLLEYRTALISAAVTGKIDVRNISGGRPDRKQ